MNAFHPGTQIVKSRCNAFDIPPRAKPDTHTPPKTTGRKPSKAMQSVVMTLETFEERAERRAKKVTDFHPVSMGTYPAPSGASKDKARAKTANLKGKL